MCVFVLFISALLPGAALAAKTKQPAVVRIWNWNIHDKKYQQNMYKLFNQRHPDIQIDYSSISVGVYAQTLEAAFIAKQPPDLFYPSGKLTFEYLRKKDLVLPLNDVAHTQAELKEWMAKYPQAPPRFVEGSTVFDGKVYIVGMRGEQGGPGYSLF